ncbi:MAG: hypothetical protein Q7W44_04175 [Coriobacteriia bacterium]|nr:hypothetical protein [Coriobacteriia bacterium]
MNESTRLADQLARAGFSPEATATISATAQAAVRRVDLAADELAAALAAGDVDAAVAAGVALASRREAAAAISNAVEPALRESYPWAEGYAFAAKAFDEAARAFTRALKATDPNTDAETILSAPKPSRDAYAALPALAHDLNAAAKLLAEVATIAMPRYVPSNPGHGLGLVASVPPENAEAALKAWTAPRAAHGRAGVWGSLTAAGATLRAAEADALAPVQAPDVPSTGPTPTWPTAATAVPLGFAE